MKKMKTRKENGGKEHSAGQLADAFERTLEGATFTAGATALVTVLGRWIAEQGERPAADVQVYGTLLAALVDAISRLATEEAGVGDVAA